MTARAARNASHWIGEYNISGNASQAEIMSPACHSDLIPYQYHVNMFSRGIHANSGRRHSVPVVTLGADSSKRQQNLESTLMDVLDLQQSRRGYGAFRRRRPLRRAQKEAVLPDWGSRDLKTGTLRPAIRQLDIDWGAFQEA